MQTSSVRFEFYFPCNDIDNVDCCILDSIVDKLLYLNWDFSISPYYIMNKCVSIKVSVEVPVSGFQIAWGNTIFFAICGKFIKAVYDIRFVSAVCCILGLNPNLPYIQQSADTIKFPHVEFVDFDCSGNYELIEIVKHFGNISVLSTSSCDLII